MSLLFKASAAAFLFPLLMHFSYAADVQPIAQDLNGQEQSVQLIRNATVKVKYNGVTFLVDPMLAPKGAYPGFTGTLHSEIRNPTIPLTLRIQEILNGVDAVLLTHRTKIIGINLLSSTYPKRCRFLCRIRRMKIC